MSENAHQEKDTSHHIKLQNYFLSYEVNLPAVPLFNLVVL